MNVIGFSEKYYTLWHIWNETIYYTALNGRHYPSHTIVHHNYIQNLSMNLEEAKKKAPDAKIDLDLRGVRSWDSTKEKDLSPHIIKFGKYAGSDVNDLIKTDLKYVLWLVENTYNPELKQIILSLPEYIEYINTRDQKLQAALDAIKTLPEGDIELTVTFEKNLRDCETHASYTLNLDGLGVYLHWDGNYNVYEYNGFTYALPTIKDKGVRVKGKTFKVIGRVEAPEVFEDIGVKRQTIYVNRIEVIKEKKLVLTP